MTWICKSSLLITTQGAIAGKAKSTSLDRLLRLFLVFIHSSEVPVYSFCIAFCNFNILFK